MKTQNKSEFSILMFIILMFIFLCDYCYGCSCFDGECPYTVPPCYRLSISDEGKCDPCLPDEAKGDGSYILTYDGSCTWETEANNLYTYYVDLNNDSNTSVGAISFIYNMFWFAGGGGGQCTVSGSTGNIFYFDEEIDSCNSVDPNTFPGTLGYGGTASWEPVWDCAACDMCDDLTTHVVVSPETIYYENLACCPHEKGEPGSITLSCDNADFVVPLGFTYTGNRALFDVIWDKNCQSGNSITYTILTIPTDPTILTPAERTATVTCKAAFFTIYGQKTRAEGTIGIGPKEGKCCAPDSGSSVAGL